MHVEYSCTRCYKKSVPLYSSAIWKGEFCEECWNTLLMQEQRLEKVAGWIENAKKKETKDPLHVIVTRLTGLGFFVTIWGKIVHRPESGEDALKQLTYFCDDKAKVKREVDRLKLLYEAEVSWA